MASHPTTLPQPLLDALARARLRPTRARIAILEALVGAPAPLSSGEIMDCTGEREVPLSTVYGNLASLESAGLVRRISFGDDFARFELSERFGGHHHHFVCTSCGRVDDLDHEPKVERALDRLAADLETEGRKIDSHRLDIVGVCASCAT